MTVKINGNQLELNKGDNLAFLFDVSGSMATNDAPGDTERLKYSIEKSVVFVKEGVKFDIDGLDGWSFGSKITPLGKLTADNIEATLKKLRAVEGGTDTAGAIKASWDAHRAGGYEQTITFVITDGAPNDEEKLLNTIAGITKELKNEYEFAISFLTVGERSPELEKFLTKLDDNIPGAVHDIVDVKKLDDVTFIEAVEGALHD